MPKELKQRMQDYFQTVWSLNHGIDIHEVENLITNIFLDIKNILTEFFLHIYPMFPTCKDAQRISRRVAWGCKHAFTSRNPSIANL